MQVDSASDQAKQREPVISSPASSTSIIYGKKTDSYSPGGVGKKDISRGGWPRKKRTDLGEVGHEVENKR